MTPTPTNLKCEFLHNPIGIGEEKPSLSWQFDKASMAWVQSAYQILVSTNQENLENNVADVWDSGKVSSGDSQNILCEPNQLSSNIRYYWKVKIWGAEGYESEWSKVATWRTGIFKQEDWHEAQWITYPLPKDITHLRDEPLQDYLDKPKPEEDHKNTLAALHKQSWWFRNTFELDELPQDPVVTISILGYIELYVNGEKVGKDILTPAASEQTSICYSISWDIQKYLKKGKNTLGVWIGRGWAPATPRFRFLFSDAQGHALLRSDDKWVCHPSNIKGIGNRWWGDFGGEEYDARKEMPLWCSSELDESDWSSAVQTNWMVTDTPHYAPLNRIGKTIPVTSIEAYKLTPNSWLVDFGTNLTGWLHMKMPQLEKGTRIKLSFADCLENKRDEGPQFFNQVSTFISGGKKDESFCHKFNYVGFRYLIVEGLETAPRTEDLKALLVEADMEKTGDFECSDSLLTKIHQVNTWTQRCLSLGSYYDDCPHRERMGYGDGQVAAEGILMSFQSHGFYRSWLETWRHLQKPDGSIPNTAPFGKGGGGPAWAGLIAAVTWRHYLYFGDTRILEENMVCIRSYVDSLEQISSEHDDLLDGEVAKYSFIGDWVAPGRGMDTENQPSHDERRFFNNCYRIYQIDLLIKILQVLKEDDLATKYREILTRLRPKVHEHFYDKNEKIYVLDNQSYYVMALMTGVTPDHLRNEVLSELEKNIVDKNEGHLDTGMLGTYFMLEYLREIDRSDLVYLMMSKTTYPGWGHMLEQGATTLWEQWNGYWSQIHSCFTSPSNWLYQALGGIQHDPEAPGFKKFILKPQLVGNIKSCHTWHKSGYGKIISKWRLQKDSFEYHVEVPANSSAKVYIPTNQAAFISVNGNSLTSNTKTTILETLNTHIVLEVGSGKYDFSVTVTWGSPLNRLVKN